jgi:hypothetical protein
MAASAGRSRIFKTAAPGIWIANGRAQEDLWLPAAWPPPLPVQLMTHVMTRVRLMSRMDIATSQLVKQSRLPLEIAPFFPVVFGIDIVIVPGSATAG